MNFRQFYLGCLAHASYYIGSGGEAAVIDPQRDVQQYLDEAEACGQTKESEPFHRAKSKELLGVGLLRAKCVVYKA